MPADSPSTDKPAVDRLSIIVFSGSFDRVHYALAMAAAALAANRAATLFFTMAATRALLAPDVSGPGWRHLHAGENGLPPVEADGALTGKGLGGFEELMAACVALGGTVMVCEMGLRALGIEVSQLRQDVPVTPGGLVTFLAEAARQGAMVFV
jgi:peroxiredoxin family protein